MEYFWMGFGKKAAADDKVVMNNPYMKFKLRKKLKDDAGEVKRQAGVAATAGGLSGIGAGAINYLMSSPKTKGRFRKSVTLAAKAGIPAAAIGGLLGASHAIGKIRQKNKTEAEMRKLQELPEFGG